MLRIKIVAIPPGFAHEHIREAWLGVEIPLATKEELKKNPLSGVKLGSENNNGFVVRREAAIRALRAAGKKIAARYWNALPAGEYLEFKKEVCQVLN